MQSERTAPVKMALIEKAAALQSSNPLGWQGFLTALSEYVDRVRDQTIQAPIAELPVAQGRAQSVSALLAVLKEAPTIAEKIRKQNGQV